MKSLVIVGAGGHGRVVAEAAQAAGVDVAGFIAEGDHPASVNGLPVIGGDEALEGSSASAHAYIVAIGDQGVRRRYAERIAALGLELATVIHPTAWISPTASIGAGSAVIGGVIVNANARIGRFCILNTGCSVDHDGRLADGVQVCPGARLAGEVTCDEDAFIGSGATIIPGVRVGARAIVGAGATIVRDVPPGVTVVGASARQAPAKTP